MFANFRFGVFFFAGGVMPNPLDIRFKKVKGLSATVKTTPLAEGGQNLYTQPLPARVEFGNLVLERGMVVGSPLRLELRRRHVLFRVRHLERPRDPLQRGVHVPVSAPVLLQGLSGQVVDLRPRRRAEGPAHRVARARLRPDADHEGMTMPVEIKELVIRAVVAPRRAPARRAPDLDAPAQEAAIEAAVKEVLRVLKASKER